MIEQYFKTKQLRNFKIVKTSNLLIKIENLLDLL